MKYLLFIMALLLGLSLAGNFHLYSLLLEQSRLSSSHQEAVDSPSAKLIATQPQVAQQSKASQEKSSGAAPKFNDPEIRRKFQKIRNWIDNGDLTLAKAELLPYLREHPSDIDFLLLEADYFAAGRDPLYALQNYYEMLDLALTTEQSLRVKEKIKQLAKQSITNLSDAHFWRVLANFIDSLLFFEPHNQDYLLALAEAYGHLGQLNLMEQTLAEIGKRNPVAENLRRSFKQPADSNVANSSESVAVQYYDNRIDLQQSADHYIADLGISSYRIALMLDTGASTTAISQQAFNRLPARISQFVGEYMVNTAAGKISAPIYRLSSVSFGPYRIRDLAVVVLPLEELEEVDGLLGMNLLSQFDFKIDQQSNQLLLTKH
jgi:clan AA aspartic protease (TIGR02281 family)